jgi:type I restriction enzyme M protein
MLNGNGEYGEFSKIFDVGDFGYREIRVERPLRLSFQVTPERIGRLKLEKTFLKLDPTEQDAIMACLKAKVLTEVSRNRDEFEKTLAQALKASGIKFGPPVKKLILSALCERDEQADICRDNDGKPEPDTELRDFELVPLKEEWESYVAREVTPFMPEAWVDQSYRDEQDHKVGRVGYEINFNRYFYKYVAPRPLTVIDQELKQLEGEITGLLKEVAG